MKQIKKKENNSPSWTRRPSWPTRWPTRPAQSPWPIWPPHHRTLAHHPTLRTIPTSLTHPPPPHNTHRHAHRRGAPRPIPSPLSSCTLAGSPSTPSLDTPRLPPRGPASLDAPAALDLFVPDVVCLAVVDSGHPKPSRAHCHLPTAPYEPLLCFPLLL